MKILLAATKEPDILGIVGNYCQKALIELGHQVEFFDFRASRYLKVPAAKFWRNKISSPFSFRKIPLINQLEIKKMSEELWSHIEAFCPDVFFTINGELIPLYILSKIRGKGIVTANWFIDEILSPCWRSIAEKISEGYDYFFTIDQEEALKYVELKSTYVEFLPLACDAQVHKSLELTEEEKENYNSEIVFVGTLVPSRERILESIARVGLRIWGPRPPESKKLQRYYCGRAVYGEEMVKVYNAAKVVLDIHGLHGSKILSVPMRPFEVTGCGAFLLTDLVDSIQKMYKIGEEVVCYHDEEELKRLIDYYLENPQLRISITKQGQKRAHQEHTYLHRMQRFISTIKGDKY